MARPRRSKYDPYKSEIIQCRLAGMTLSQIAEQLADRIDADERSICYFCRSREIPTLIMQGAHGARRELIPLCNGCKDCYEIDNVNADGKDKVCRKSNRRISVMCLTSPMWCEKRKDIKNNVRVKQQEYD